MCCRFTSFQNALNSQRNTITRQNAENDFREGDDNVRVQECAVKNSSETGALGYGQSCNMYWNRKFLLMMMLLVLFVSPGMASMSVCQPVSGRTIDHMPLMNVAPEKDTLSQPFSALNYTKRITIRPSCRAMLADYFVTVQGDCYVQASISWEGINNMTSPLHSEEVHLQHSVLENKGTKFSDNQKKAWLQWQGAAQEVYRYHIDIRIRPWSGMECLVRPGDGVSTSIIISLLGNQYFSKMCVYIYVCVCIFVCECIVIIMCVHPKE